MPSSVPGEPARQESDARAQQIDQCKAAALTGVGLLGPAHGLLVGATGIMASIVFLLLTGAQAFAVFSIVSAILVVRELKKDADLDPLVVRFPIACCCAAGTLLVVATCVVHWKAACGIAVLAVVFLLLAHHRTMLTFGKRVVNWGAAVLSLLRTSRVEDEDLEMGASAADANGEEVVNGLDV